MLDLLIIGAGPAGISAAYEAKKAGLDYVVIEKGLIGNTIYTYPVGLTVFSTTNELEFEPGDLKPAREKPTREELLSYYVRFVLDNELYIRTEEMVTKVERSAFDAGGTPAFQSFRVTTDKAERSKLIGEAQEAIAKDLSTIPLLQGAQVMVAGTDVKGVEMTLDASFKTRLGVMSK